MALEPLLKRGFGPHGEGYAKEGGRSEGHATNKNGGGGKGSGKDGSKDGSKRASPPPKRGSKRPPAAAKGASDEATAAVSGKEVKQEAKKEVWVILRPPLVTEEALSEDGSPLSLAAGLTVRVVFTFVFRHPGASALGAALTCGQRFRIRFVPHPQTTSGSGSSSPSVDAGWAGEACAKFEIQPELVNLL
jgi:hypothetical protein